MGGISQVYYFGPFSLDPEERQLLRKGVPIHLTEKAFDTLLLLLQRKGHIVHKHEFLKSIWLDTFVEESCLMVNISILRKALGDDGHRRKYIETVYKHGYRFIGDVKEMDGS